MKPLKNATLNSLFQSFGENLCCPRTQQDLQWKDNELSNQEGIIYPLLNSIPWLSPEPHISLAHWLEKRQDLNLYFTDRLQHITKSLNEDRLIAPTRERLQKTKKALEHNQKVLQHILSPLPALTSLLASGDKIPSHQSLTLYLKNIFRDWFWSTDENQKSLEVLKKILPEDWSPEKFVVLGSGASRFAVDLHHSNNLRHTLAVDFNPLLLLMAQQALEQADIKLYDLPTAPLEISQVATEYSLQNPYPESKSFHLLFADIQALPFKEKTLDSVLTPWVIDILPLRFETLARKINQILKPSGEWLNFGPLGFMSSQESQRLTFEEIQEILKTCGFKVEKHNFEEVPYLHSPGGNQKRYEKVLAFRAIKIEDAESEKFQYLPDWLTNHDLPIPFTEDIKTEQARAKINADIIFSLNGKSSINELIKLMSQQYQIPAEHARQLIINYLTRYHEKRLRRD